MEKKKFVSLSKKLFWTITIAAFIVLVPLLGSIFYVTIEGKKSDAIESLLLSSKIMSKNLTASVDFDLVDDAQKTLSTFSANNDIDGAFIYLKNKKLFTSYINKNSNKKNLIHIVKQMISQCKNSHQVYDKKDYLIVCTQIQIDDDLIGYLWVIANKTKLYKAEKKILYMIIIIFLLSFGVIIFIAKIIDYMFILPIFKMKDAMQEVVVKNNYDIMLHSKSNDEFQILFDGFHTMLSTIKALIEKLEGKKRFNQILLDSQEQIIITLKNKKLITANRSFYQLFEIDSLEEFPYECICDLFLQNTSKEYLQKHMGDIDWIDYIIQNPAQNHKVQIRVKNKIYIYNVTASVLEDENHSYAVVFTDITSLENSKKEIESINKHIRDSIEYAALIQSAILPNNNNMRRYFKDQFVIWHPKDTVGGDIYFFEELYHSDECLLFVIDCTGHGVPGAFVTMLVKAVEQQIMAHILNNRIKEISPGWMMGYFNRELKKLLKQENRSSISNVGWDGAIIYYNRQEQILKFAGAQTPLFYVDTNGELKTIKGNRYSVGYKTCHEDYEYKETVISVHSGMKFYCTTDGYLDQNGGEKGFPFGKRRFENIIKEYYQESMADQQEVFLYTLDEYESMIDDNERNDDVTVIGFEIGEKVISI